VNMDIPALGFSQGSEMLNCTSDDPVLCG
jgi:hypothetical protein